MNRVIPRVRTDKRKSYIEMYAKPQKECGNKVRGYVHPRAILSSGGVVRGGFVSMGDRKVEVKKELSSAPSMTKRGGSELKVEKKDYQMPPEPSVIIALKKKIAEEDRKRAEGAAKAEVVPVKRDVKETAEEVRISEPMEPPEVPADDEVKGDPPPDIHSDYEWKGELPIKGEGAESEPTERAASLPRLEGGESDGRRERRRKRKHRHGV
jgi:hypothetical protein